MHSILLAEATMGAVSEDYSLVVTDIRQILETLQMHLEMDVVFIGELTENERIIRHLVTKERGTTLRVNVSDPRSETYCDKIISGAIPPIVKDTHSDKITKSLPITGKLSIGCYMGVPITLLNGVSYGTLCCFKNSKDESLQLRDLKLLQAFSELVGMKLSRMIDIETRTTEIKARVQSVLDNSSIQIVFQPVYDLKQKRVVTFEALSRFQSKIQKRPDIWFKEAKEVGLGKELEILAIKSALVASKKFPDDINVSINISPEYILSGDLTDCLQGIDVSKLLIEITEHEKIESYADFNIAFNKLKQRGARLAVDDVGAGHANFFHIIELQPDVIKLDMSLTRNIDADFHRQALARALIAFSRSVGARIIAEGIETESELNTLNYLGVDKAQGYFVGRPVDVDKATTLLKGTQGYQNSVCFKGQC